MTGKHPNPEWIALASTGLTAKIDPLGAQLSALCDSQGRDLLWGGDPAVWAGRAPVLFPIVGALHGGSYRLGNERYELSRHGFARGTRFGVIVHEPARAVLRLTADAATRRVYPFDFELDVEFRLHTAILSIESSIVNRGSAAMYASFGYHPAFRWPLPYGDARSAHSIEFSDDEPGPVRQLDGDGLVAPEPLPTPIADRRLSLHDELFRNDAIIFDSVRSRHVTYGAGHGPRIQVAFPDSPYLGIWTKPGADFICIEPWNGIADPQGFSGDFSEKPGVFQIAPGSRQSIKIAISLLPAA
jgi:galactose mutarotase-like enzyme